MGPFYAARLVDFVEARPVVPRHVFVLTDGMCAPRVPSDPKRWTWVLPDGGHDWMTERNAGSVVRFTV